jgi:tetratricopeptide (TPR) repeat protein
VGFTNLGVEEYAARDFEAAASAFAKAAELAPRNPRPVVYLGDSQSLVPALKESARRTYERALPLVDQELLATPDDPLLLILKARCQLRLDERKESLATLKRAVTSAPDDEDVLYSAAQVAAIGGNADLALAWLGQARRLGMGTTELQRDPDFDSLRNLPAFRELTLNSTSPAPNR